MNVTSHRNGYQKNCSYSPQIGHKLVLYYTIDFNIYLGPSRRGVFYLWFHHVLFLLFPLFFVQSQKSQHLVGYHHLSLYMFCGPFVHWQQRRGRKNFCLQKSRMPLAGLVYLLFGFWYSPLSAGVPLAGVQSLQCLKYSNLLKVLSGQYQLIQM